MPISRPLLIALIAAVVAAAGFYATQGARNQADTAPDVAAVPEPAPVPDSTPAKPEAVKAVKAEKAEKATGSAKRDAAAQAKRAKRDAVTGIPGVPAPVQRAIADRKLVVLFFYQPGSADDERTERSVVSLRRRDVAVFTSPIGRLASYRGLVGELGISQAPAVVIVKQDRTARVIEGYIDPATLAQDVADAR